MVCTILIFNLIVTLIFYFLKYRLSAQKSNSTF
jgi:hypothetical protein